MNITHCEISSGSSVKFLDTYVDETGEEVLVICCNNAILVLKDGTLIDKNIIIELDRHWPMMLIDTNGYLILILIFALLINLVIRKKTLLFKQIAFTIPILVILIVLIAVNLYSYFINRNNETIRREVSIIAELGAEELEDCDFSGLLEVNGNTGEAYCRQASITSRLSITELTALMSYWQEATGLFSLCITFPIWIMLMRKLLMMTFT